MPKISPKITSEASYPLFYAHENRQKRIECATEAISATQREAQTSLCTRIFKVLKKFFEKIFCCLCRRFKEKEKIENQKKEKNPVPQMTSQEKEPLDQEIKSKQEVSKAEKFEPSKPKEMALPIEPFNFQLLPKEMKVEILGNLDGKSIAAFSCTSKESNNLVETTLVKPSEKAFIKVMDLMFSDRSLELDGKPIVFTGEQLEKRYEDLKLALENILPKHINAMIEYTVIEEIGIVKVTLLDQAIVEIKDADKRIEIIKILLSKGADPTHYSVFSNGNDEIINPLSRAKYNRDPQLIDLLTQAINEKKPKSNRKEKSEKIIQKVDEKERLSQKAYMEAIDLMFHDRKLRWEDADQLKKPLSAEDLAKRHEELKLVLEKISPKHINFIITYRDGMMTRCTTLLLQAILNIQDSERRLEIVKALLSMGADPCGQGFYYKPVVPLQKAIRIGDQKLVDVLNEAIKAQADKK